MISETNVFLVRLLHSLDIDPCLDDCDSCWWYALIKKKSISHFQMLCINGVLVNFFFKAVVNASNAELYKYKRIRFSVKNQISTHRLTKIHSIVIILSKQVARKACKFWLIAKWWITSRTLPWKLVLIKYYCAKSTQWFINRDSPFFDTIDGLLDQMGIGFHFCLSA